MPEPKDERLVEERLADLEEKQKLIWEHVRDLQVKLDRHVEKPQGAGGAHVKPFVG